MSLYICLALVGRFSPTQSTNSNSIPSLVDKSDDSAVRNGVSRGSSDLSIVPGEGIHTYQKVRTFWYVCIPSPGTIDRSEDPRETPFRTAESSDLSTKDGMEFEFVDCVGENLPTKARQIYRLISRC